MLTQENLNQQQQVSFAPLQHLSDRKEAALTLGATLRVGGTIRYPTRKHTTLARLATHLMSWLTMRRTVSTGMAKPKPAVVSGWLVAAVLTPIRRPRLSSSGPPELPVRTSGLGGIGDERNYGRGCER